MCLSKNEYLRWKLFPAQSAHGVVVLAHGLNQNPESWSDLTFLLNKAGLTVCRIQLTGHVGTRSFEEMENVEAQTWLAEIRSACSEMQERYSDLPLYFLGYSMGALLGVLAQLLTKTRLFSRQILFAPALSIKAYTRLALPLSAILGYLPSRAGSHYVANRKGISQAGYSALFSLIKELECQDKAAWRVVDIPTLVVMRKKDELIRYTGIDRLMSANKLQRWRLVTLNSPPENSCVLKYSHLMVDRVSLGPAGWELISDAIQQYFHGSA